MLKEDSWMDPNLCDEEWMDESMGEELEEEEERYQQSDHCQNKVFSQWISREEYLKQGNAYTKQSIQELVQSPEYQAWHYVCSSCHANWFHGNSSSDCKECDGFGMTRPCPICRGDKRCNALWERDVDMTHSFKSAHWSGKCNLPESEQQALVLRHLVESDPDSLAEALVDLGNT